MFGIIYKVTNKINSKVYIGQTIRTLNKRKAEHYSRSKNIVKYFYNALNKYSEESFVWEIIEYCDSKEELDEMEFHYIMQYDSYSNGYNLTLGGEGTYNYKHSEAALLKISKIRKGIKLSKKEINSRAEKQSYDWEIINPDGNIFIIRNLSKFCAINDLDRNSMYRVSRGDRQCYKGYKCSLITPSTKVLSSKVKANRINHNLGRKHSKKTIAKIIENNSKEYLVIFPDKTCVKIKNLKKWCIDNSLLYSSAMRVVSGSRSHYKNYIFERFNQR